MLVKIELNQFLLLINACLSFLKLGTTLGNDSFLSLFCIKTPCSLIEKKKKKKILDMRIVALLFWYNKYSCKISGNTILITAIYSKNEERYLLLHKNHNYLFFK